MKAFFAIAALSWKQAIRSRFFLVLLVLTLLWSLSIPLAIAETNAADFLRVLLLYSLSGITFLLGSAAIWLGCFAMTSDLENGQINLTVTKPVSRTALYTAKWLGVFSLTLTLMAIASTAVYLLLMYRFNNSGFDAEQKEKIREEVLTARKVYLPKRADYNTRAKEILEKKLSAVSTRSNFDLNELHHEAVKEAVAEDSKSLYKQPKIWVWENLPADRKEKFSLRYRLYVNQISKDNQRKTKIFWQVGVPQLTSNETSGRPVVEKSGNYQIYFYPLTEIPEEILSGVFTEKKLPSNWHGIAPDGKVFMAMVNFDDQKSDQYIQPGDGPALLLKAATFPENFIRSVLVSAIALAVLSALGCTLGAICSMPTAVFIACSYLAAGTIASLMIGNGPLANTGEAGQFMAKAVLTAVIPLQEFDTTSLLAGGELIEWKLVWKVFFNFFICRTLPLAVIGIWIYRRRELGMAVKR